MIVITAASGQFGRLVLEDLLRRGVTAADIRAVVRDKSKLADFAGRGVEVVEGDYTNRESLVAALRGADAFLFVSSSGPNEDRAAHHANAVSAAAEAGVGRIVYTSIPQADTNPIGFAWVHKDTENAIKETGLPYTFLRNNWYFENSTGTLGTAVEHGALLSATGDGKIAFAARADYAEAAVVVLTTDGHEGKTYELTGDTAITLGDLAAETAKQAGKDVAHVSLPQEEYQKALEGFGLPAFLAGMLADADAHISGGALAATDPALSTLIGRPTTSVEQAVAAALA
jgi:NAD(P)H dehydrogenase (quinone)